MANDWVAKHNKTVADREVKKAQARREERQRKLAGEQEPETPPEGEDEAFHQWLTDGGSEHDVEIELTEEQMAQIPEFSWPGGIPTPAYPLPPHHQRLLDHLKREHEDVAYEGGGVREAKHGHPRFELLVPLGVPYEEQLLTRFAVHMAKGAEKYEERNWEKFEGVETLERAKAGALRHLYQWLTDEQDGEDHAAAVMFNLMAAEHIKNKMRGIY